MPANLPDGVPALQPDNCPAYIMAGGRSSRFGSDKALVAVDGQPLLLRLRSALQQAGHTVQVVADRAERYAQLGINCLVDRQSDSGPLAGVATALEHRSCIGDGWLLLLNCDQWQWQPAWFTELAKQAPSLNVQRQIDSISFLSLAADNQPRVEPFPSLLHTSLLSTAVAGLSQTGRGLHRLFASQTSVGIQAESNPQQWSFNTHEELQRLQAQFAAGDSSTKP